MNNNEKIKRYMSASMIYEMEKKGITYGMLAKRLGIKNIKRNMLSVKHNWTIKTISAICEIIEINPIIILNYGDTISKFTTDELNKYISILEQIDSYNNK